MYIGIRVKYSLFPSSFNEILTIWTDFRKILELSNFMKIRPVGAKLFHVDGRTDAMKLTVPFRNFANEPLNQ